jgi:hypothetical protein
VVALYLVIVQIVAAMKRLPSAVAGALPSYGSWAAAVHGGLAGSDVSNRLPGMAILLTMLLVERRWCESPLAGRVATVRSRHDHARTGGDRLP